MSHRYGTSYCRCVVLIAFSLAGCSDDPASGPTGPTVIRDVRVFDGTTTIARATVMIQGERIVEVGATVSAPSGATVIEGAGKTLLPGFIDAHAHVSNAGQLEQSTLFGATTVLDMGCGDPQLGAALRKSSGEPGSKLAELRFGGYGVTTPRGHCTEFGFPVPTLTEPSEVQSFVDARIAEGSDYIKIIYDDGRAYGIEFATISKETLVAAVEAAHRRAKLAIVHVGTSEDARDAIEAGADGLTHLFVDRSPDPDFGSLLASRGSFAMPTLSVLRMVTGSSVGPSVATDPLMAPYLSTYAINGLNQTFPPPPKPVEMSYAAAEESVRMLKAASVPLLAGSDAPNPGTTHGATVHSELRLLVTAGLTPVEALAAATSVPAERFGLADRGRVAPAMRADLVLVNGDPTADIAVTTHIEAVWKGGVRLDREAYRLRK